MSRRDDLRVVERAITQIARISMGRGAARIRAERAGVDVSRPGVAMLSMLHERGPLRPSVLAEAVRLDAPLVSRELGVLTAQGLVESGVDPADARARIVSLLPKGKKQIERYRAGIDEIVEELFCTWSAAELKDLAETLTRVADDFSGNASRAGVGD